MDMNFWQQFCTSPTQGGGTSSPDLSDLDSSPGWSPLSSLEDQENYVFPMQTSYQSHTLQHTQLPHHHNHFHQAASSPPSSAASPTASSVSDLELLHPGAAVTAHRTSTSSSRAKNPVKRVQQRTAANHRERKRMKTINEAFEGLRERIPLASGDRKLSKVDTLRLAIRYIHHLSDMVTTCGKVDGQTPGQAERDAAKVIIRCHGSDLQDYCGDANGNFPLYGHSLSWADDKETKVGPNGRLVAKLWIPESAEPGSLSEHYDCESLPL